MSAIRFRGDNDDPEATTKRSTEMKKSIEISYFVLGAATLLSWNVILNAIPYFVTRLHGSRYETTFVFYITAIFMTVKFGFQGISTVTGNSSTTNSRMKSSILWTLFLNILLALSTLISLNEGVLFSFILLNASLQAVASGYLQTALMASTALNGAKALQRAIAGQAAVGVVTSLVQLINVVLGSKSKTHSGSERGGSNGSSASGLFAAAIVFTAISYLAHVHVVATFKQREDALTTPEVLAADREIWTEIDRLLSDSASNAPPKPRYDVQSSVHVDVAEVQSVEPEGEHETTRMTALQILRLNSTYNISVASIFAITCVVFPAITTSITSVHLYPSPLSNPALFQTLHFLFFNIGDLVGRFILSIPGLFVTSRFRLAQMTFWRLIFIPLFLVCNMNPNLPPQSPPPSLPVPPGSFLLDSAMTMAVTTLNSMTRTLEHPLIRSDSTFFAIILLFGLTNGYISTLIMICASSTKYNPLLRSASIVQRSESTPTDDEDEEEEEEPMAITNVDTAATVASFCLSFGLVIGGVMSFGVRSIMCGGCNPFVGP